MSLFMGKYRDFKTVDSTTSDSQHKSNTLPGNNRRSQPNQPTSSSTPHLSPATSTNTSGFLPRKTPNRSPAISLEKEFVDIDSNDDPLDTTLDLFDISVHEETATNNANLPNLPLTPLEPLDNLTVSDYKAEMKGSGNYEPIRTTREEEIKGNEKKYSESPKEMEKLKSIRYRIQANISHNILDYMNEDYLNHLFPTYKLPKVTVPGFKITLDFDVLDFEGFLRKITERETSTEFILDFVLTYREICDPVSLFGYLIDRFWGKGHDTGTARLRVLQILHSWVENCFSDWEQEYEILYPRLQEFCVQCKRLYPQYQKTLDALIHKIDKKISGLSFNTTRFIRQPPTPVIYPKLSKRDTDSYYQLSLLTIDPLEIARQLTLIDEEIFNNTQNWEFLCFGCFGHNRKETAPNISTLVKRFNQVVLWVQTEVLTETDQMIRIQKLKQCIDVMENLYELHNFQSLVAFYQGLKADMVIRLKNTWSGLSKNSIQFWQSIEQLLNPENNFQNLKRKISETKLPLCPFFGICLSELHSVFETLKIITPNVVPWRRSKQIANIITELLHYKQEPYCFFQLHEIREWLLNPWVSDIYFLHTLSYQYETDHREEIQQQPIILLAIQKELQELQSEILKRKAKVSLDDEKLQNKGLIIPRQSHSGPQTQPSLSNDLCQKLNEHINTSYDKLILSMTKEIEQHRQQTLDELSHLIKTFCPK